MNNFDDIFRKGVKQMRDHGLNPYPERYHIRMVNARQQLEAGLRYYLGDKVRWIPAYDDVVAWMTDNQQKGLLCVGTCGLGKTLICQNILPVLLQQNLSLVTRTYSAMDMNEHIKELCKLKLCMVDDIGTEPSVKMEYGNKTVPFFELCDAAEKQGNLLILTSNLRTTYGHDKETGEEIPSIQWRYGDLVLSRLRGIVKVVKFEGQDMRLGSMAHNTNKNK